MYVCMCVCTCVYDMIHSTRSIIDKLVNWFPLRRLSDWDLTLPSLEPRLYSYFPRVSNLSFIVIVRLLCINFCILVGGC